MTIPLHTLSGVPDTEITQLSFSAGDGLALMLTRFRRGVGRNAVLLVHGLGTSSDLFIMPEHPNLVVDLLSNGFDDVWCLDTRMSNRFPYNLTRHDYTCDHVVLYDLPAAVALMRTQTGRRPIYAVGHGLGAMALMMGVFSRRLLDVAGVIANGVALTPRVHPWMRFKLAALPFVVETLLGQPYISPNWATERGFTRLPARLAGLFHPSCNQPACRLLSLAWGHGSPSLFNHENLAEASHRRCGDLFGAVNLNYHRHLLKMVRHGHAVKYRDEADFACLPYDYLSEAARVTTPCYLITGAENRVFTDSNQHCFGLLERAAPGRHQLHVFPNYGHQDIFMGKNAHQDIFPTLRTFLAGMPK